MMGKVVVGVAVASSSLAGRKGSEEEKMRGHRAGGVVLLLRLVGLWGRREEVREWRSERRVCGQGMAGK